jgi:hypothetical protein
MVRLVIRVFDAQLSELLRQTFGINTVVYSTSALAAPDFVAAALDRMNMRFVNIGGLTQAIVRLHIQPLALDNLPLLALHQEEGITILLHAHNGRVDIPPQLENHLQVGDEIIVMATEEKLESLNRRNQPTHELLIKV